MSDVKALLSRLETVTARLESVEKQLANAGSGSGSSGGGASSASGSEWVAEFNRITAEHIPKYVELSSKIDPTVHQQAQLVQQAIAAQAALLAIAAKSKKPTADVFARLLKPTADLVTKVIEIRNSNRGHSHWNHLSTLSEGIAALGWVQVEPTPGPHVDESRSSSEFYSNKLLREYRGKDATQEGWIKGWNQWLKDLRVYIKQYHTTGLSWNPSGGDASQFAGASTTTTTTTGSTGSKPKPTPTKAAAKGGFLAELGGIAKRQEQTGSSGLRKVSREERKRPPASSKVPASSASKKPAARKWGAAGATKTYPPKFELQGNKWVVEYQKDNKEIIINETEVRHTVYIYKCENSVIQIKGKVNAITLDGSKKTGVVFDNAVSTCEVINCQSVQVQCTGRVPSMTVDKTSGCQLFISRNNLDVKIVSAKSSEMNVVIPGKTDSDDPTELPIPEQFTTTVQGNKLVTEPLEHTG